MKVTMTPEWAKELLATNTNNRPLSKSLVDKYAADITAGRWQYNGDPIRRSTTGVLLDGQHRLQACIKAGRPFETEFLDGLPDEIFPTIDTGRKRSASDAIVIAGYSTRRSVINTAGLAASCRLILNYLNGIHLKTAVSSPAIVELLRDNSAISEFHALGRTSYPIMPPGPIGAVLFLASREPTLAKRIQQFVEPLAEGAGLERGDARLALRNAFIETRRKQSGRGGMNPDWSFNVIAAGWNAFAVGDELYFVRPQQRKAKVINVIGGPKFGAGVAALALPIKLHGNLRRSIEGDNSPNCPAT